MDSKTLELAIEKATEYVATHPLPTDVVAVPLDHKLVAEHIDHTLLKPDATPAQITVLCEEAKRYGFKVNTDFVVHYWRTIIHTRSELLCEFISHPARHVPPVRVLLYPMCRGRLPARCMRYLHQSI